MMYKLIPEIISKPSLSGRKVVVLHSNVPETKNRVDLQGEGNLGKLEVVLLDVLLEEVTGDSLLTVTCSAALDPSTELTIFCLPSYLIM